MSRGFFSADTGEDAPLSLSSLLLSEPGSIDTRPLLENPKANLANAAARGAIERVKQLLDEGKNIDAPYELKSRLNALNGGTALHFAVAYNELSMVHYLVETAGADINATSKMDFSPLMIAAFQGHKEIALYLIKHGADTHKTKNLRFNPDSSKVTAATAADIAKAKGHEETFAALKKPSKARCCIM